MHLPRSFGSNRRPAHVSTSTHPSTPVPCPPPTSRRAGLLSMIGVGLGLGLGLQETRWAVAEVVEPTVSSDVIEMLEAQAGQYYADREFIPARDILSKLVDLQPKTPRWREFRGAILVDNKEFDKALIDYNTAFDLLDASGLGDQLTGRDRARLHAGRALVYEGLSEWEAALTDYDKAIDLARTAGYLDDPYLINSRANVLASLGRWGEARDGYLIAANIFQSSKGLRGWNGSTTQRLDGWVFSSSNAALALVQLGDETAALREMEKIARRAPGSEDMRSAMAALYYRAGRQQEAEQIWNFACESISVGCVKYQDQNWLRTVRRWPPRMVTYMQDFLQLRRASGA